MLFNYHEHLQIRQMIYRKKESFKGKHSKKDCSNDILLPSEITQSNKEERLNYYNYFFLIS